MTRPQTARAAGEAAGNNLVPRATLIAEQFGIYSKIHVKEDKIRERERKRESRRQASETQREKGRQRSRARDKKQRRHILLSEKQQEMLAATMANARRIYERQLGPDRLCSAAFEQLLNFFQF